MVMVVSEAMPVVVVVTVAVVMVVSVTFRHAAPAR